MSVASQSRFGGDSLSAGRPNLDLIVTLGDAIREICSALLVEPEGTASSFIGLNEVIATKGLLSSLRADRKQPLLCDSQGERQSRPGGA
jgi:hypothetical protein